MLSILLYLLDGGRWSYSYWVRYGPSLVGTIWMVDNILRGSFPLWLRISLSIVYSRCWWCDDVATVFAIKSALFLYGILRYKYWYAGSTFYLIGIPVAQFICLVILRFRNSNYWNVLVPFLVYIIMVLLDIARDILRYGGHNLFRRILGHFRAAAPLILQLSSFYS